MWNTIIFDLDGTLTDSQAGITNSVAYALSHFGIREEHPQLLKFVGPPLHESFREYYGFNQEQIDQGVVKFREYFNAKGWLENAPYPGVEALLRELKAAGLRLMVATSKPEEFALRILEHFHLAEYFDGICGAPMDEQAGARKAAVLRRALTASAAAGGGAAVMVGDRRQDVMGAHEVGVPCIGVLYGYGDREELESAGAEFIAEDLGDLQRILLR